MGKRGGKGLKLCCWLGVIVVVMGLGAMDKVDGGGNVGEGRMGLSLKGD